MVKVFLMCSERSGSNFISRLLNAHSLISSPAPKHLFNPILRNLYRYEPLTNDENWNELLNDIEKLFNVGFTYWVKQLSFEELRQNAQKGNVKDLLNYIFESEAKFNGKSILFIKENKIYDFFPFLQINYQDAKYVFQSRDPRDMALSWRNNKTHRSST